MDPALEFQIGRKCGMLTEQEFFGLLKRPEGETLDFKQDSYDLSLDHKKFDLIKDVLCMANTPRDHDSHIVLGVKKYPDGRFDLLGIEQHPDEELLQSQFTDKVYPIPRFTYEAVWYKENTFGVITIPPERIGPCAPLRDYGRTGNFLRQRQIYFRRGSKNDVAGPEDAKSIFNWIGFEGLQVDQILQGTTHGEEWERFLVLQPHIHWSGTSSRAPALDLAPYYQRWSHQPVSGRCHSQDCLTIPFIICGCSTRSSP